MKYLLFDTETTGLPVNPKTPASSRPDNWPHLVSISWNILDTETNQIIKRANYIVKPLQWIIPEESTRIHGITTEDVQRYGHNLVDVMRLFMNEECDALVAHNMDFDYNVVYNAVVWDLRLPFTLESKPRYCTMNIGRYICKIPSQYGGFKSPKLIELYEYVFHKKPMVSMLHNSAYDTLILTEIVQVCDDIRIKMNLPIRDIVRAARNEVKEDTSVLKIRINDAEGT